MRLKRGGTVRPAMLRRIFYWPDAARDQKRESGMRNLNIVSSLAVAALAALIAAPTARAETPAKIGIDYAYYNPVGLLMKDKGWLEQEFSGDKVKLEWVLSAGSNKALEYLNGGSVDFGSSAGSAALPAKANRNPIKAVYIYSKPEWAALVLRKDFALTQ